MLWKKSFLISRSENVLKFVLKFHEIMDEMASEPGPGYEFGRANHRVRGVGKLI